MTNPVLLLELHISRSLVYILVSSPDQRPSLRMTCANVFTSRGKALAILQLANVRHSIHWVVRPFLNVAPRPFSYVEKGLMGTRLTPSSVETPAW